MGLDIKIPTMKMEKNETLFWKIYEDRENI